VIGSAADSVARGGCEAGYHPEIVATLHFCAGKAGAGKTTLARKIARETPAVLICEDEWVSRIADPVTNLREYIGAATKLRGVLAPHIMNLLRLGVSVVFDFGGNTVRDRNWVRTIFEEANADHVLHYIRADDQTCRARVQVRNQTKPDGIFFGTVTEAQVEEVNRYFTAPTAEEHFNIIVYDV
jgi:predicted kinase